ncbi:MAG: helix-turn-helix domain-containing protein [Thermoplasmata archaeon]|nr:helix-turn-helix domain-containing protein [Thermoplasmata archaeon]
MALWEFDVRSSYEYPFMDLTREVPGTPISMWCLWTHEMLQVPTRDPKTLERVAKAIRKAGRVVDEWADVRGGRVFLLKCTCYEYTSIWNLMNAHQCWDAPPVVYQDGWGSFRMLSFSERNGLGLFRDLKQRGPTELVKKREIALSVLPTSVWTDTLFGALTERQMTAMLEAHRAGYYQSPRRVGTDVIAQGIGVSRSTYEEHLRKAESRILDAVVPFLQLYRSSERPSVHGPRAGTESDEAGS